MNIKIFANNTNNRGPGKVYQNLVSGMKQLGHGVNESIIGEPDLNVCLQMVPNINSLNSTKTLFGPNLVVLPSERPQLFESDRRFLVPSDWVKFLYSFFPFVNKNNLHVWSVGIDTDTWKPSKVEPTLDFFVYIKQKSAAEKQFLISALKTTGYSFKVIEYGSYREEQLKELCDISKACLLFTGTESQGIAYMQILATGTPCYAIDQIKWVHPAITCLATSVPYFDSRCGIIDKKLKISHLKEIINRHESYSPREYILENHTLAQSAQRLVRIFEETNGQ